MAAMQFRPLKWLGAIVTLTALLFVSYLWVVLTWSFSAGERAGYVQKLSNQGWLCKTWEEGSQRVVSARPGTS